MTANHKISVIIVDDELLAQRLLETYLLADEEIEILDSCSDGAHGLLQIEKLKPDLVFLDIQMPELTGLELLEELDGPRPFVVFVTAYDNYAIKAFEENALDYLLKPFNKARFSKMLAKVKEVIYASVRNDQTDQIMAALASLTSQNRSYIKKLPIKEKGKITFVSLADIFWIESAGAFTKLHLKDGFKTHNPSLKQLSETLNPQEFIRVHKSHIVNVKHIKSIEPYFHGEYVITLSNETTLKLSRSYKDRLDAILNQYM